jgi:hypothetical protein
MNRHQRHILRLAKKHNIEICFNKPHWTKSSAEYNTTTSRINVVPSKGKEKYEAFAASLHEMGHILLDRSRSQKENNKYVNALIHNQITKLRLHEEADAWEISCQLAGKLWNQRMTLLRGSSLATYIARYAQSHKRWLPFTKIHSLITGDCN